MTKTIVRKRRMKESLSLNHSMTNICSLTSKLSKFAILCLFLGFISLSEAASVTGSRNVRHIDGSSVSSHRANSHYRLLGHQNEYDGGGVLDDDTLRLSLAIDDDSTGGLSAPSLHILEPKVYLRVSGESGMIAPSYQVDRKLEVSSFPTFRASSTNSKKRGGMRRTDLDFQSESSNYDEEPVEVEDATDDEDMNDNYHHHFPYIESYREKYVRPESRHFLVTTTPSPPPSQTLSLPNSKKESSPKQEWSDLIAQVTTPSSFNEINSSASEHRLADFHFRANLPSYFYNKYSTYSEEDLENVADLDDEHSKYFVKTRPRSVTTAGSNIYSNFYYEPPSFSTKSVPIPVKTKEKVVFVSAKPTQEHYHQHLHSPLFEEGDTSIHHDDEVAQQDASVMTTISTNFTTNVPTMTPPQISYDREEGEVNHQIGHYSHLHKTLLKSVTPSQKDKEYYKSQQNLNSASNNNKSSSETLDVSTSQSILSKVTVNNPHYLHQQILHIRPEFSVKSLLATPDHYRKNDYIGVTSEVKIASNSDSGGDTSSSTSPTTEHPPTTVEINAESLSTSTQAPSTTTTDATSIPGLPGVDYPTLGEIPQTGFDCAKQRYKGFFADIDTKCQAWHYCDFQSGHSTFLCPNGTLFSQVLLTCDWWFNVDCNQARQLYVLNERLYRYIKPPKPSFPEDFIGEHVDKWLLQQFNNGYLPKVRKKSKAKYVGPPLPHPNLADPSPAEDKKE